MCAVLGDSGVSELLDLFGACDHDDKLTTYLPGSSRQSLGLKAPPRVLHLTVTVAPAAVPLRRRPCIHTATASP